MTKKRHASGTSFTIHRDIALREAADGLVILHLKTAKYWHINGTGARVLQAVETGNSPYSANESICAETGTPLERVEQDISDFLEAMCRAQILIQS